jgi:hypothetical protein
VIDEFSGGGKLSGDWFRLCLQQPVLIPLTCPLQREEGDTNYEMHGMHVAG